MPDFKRIVRENLPLPPMKRRREEKIIEELAGQLADLYHDARARGLDDERALADALGQIPDWEAFAASLRRAVRTLDPDVPIGDARTADDIVRRWLQDDRVLAGFLAGLAALALGLGSVGLFGMMASLVAGRTREIGIRMALGAAKADVLGLVMRRCLRLAVAGVVAGLLLAAPSGYVLASQLYGVSGADPLSDVSVTALLLAIALIAGYLPARRALRVDPMIALRHE